ncbi:MAG TPA: hypothetical protein VFV34_24755 [Blastocatellia bacterium]|nr:hypothetical protein [Blastocatellia bacterium]
MTVDSASMDPEEIVSSAKTSRQTRFAEDDFMRGQAGLQWEDCTITEGVDASGHISDA